MWAGYWSAANTSVKRSHTKSARLTEYERIIATSIATTIEISTGRTMSGYATSWVHIFSPQDGRDKENAATPLNAPYSFAARLPSHPLDPATTLIRAAARERGFARMTISTS
jgi:hypothetical protein